MYPDVKQKWNKWMSCIVTVTKTILYTQHILWVIDASWWIFDYLIEGGDRAAIRGWRRLHFKITFLFFKNTTFISFLQLIIKKNRSNHCINYSWNVLWLQNVLGHLQSMTSTYSIFVLHLDTKQYFIRNFEIRTDL